MSSIGSKAAGSAGAFFLTVIWAGIASAQVTISSAATQNMSCSAGVCVPTATQAVLNTMDLKNLLAAGNVEVSTTGSGIQADDIRIADGVFWTNKSKLALDAYHSIIIGAAVSIKGKGGLSLLTNDGGTGGLLSFGNGGNATFAHLSSTLTINGTLFVLKKTLPRLVKAIAAHPSGAFALVDSYDATADGTYRAAPIATTFTGTFNGLGNTISGLTINGKAKNALIGLFAEVDTAGTVSSVRISGANITAKQSSVAGPLAGVNLGTLFNVFASGQVLLARAEVGGVEGGLVGASQGLIKNAGSTATVSVRSRKAVTSADVGGLVGDNDGMIDQSYATGPVTIDQIQIKDTSYAGGLVGFNDDLVENCYATGSANGPNNSVVGGLVGLTYSTIAYSYSTGAPQGGSGSYVGGLVGYDDHQANGGNITNNYWDTTTSGITDLSQGAGNVANDPGITGQTTEQLQSGLPDGFDPTIWAEAPNINNGLPYLIANPPVQ
ncbi:MAG TPA: GLUG motif-containing protein [Rhizomicrobium sp.]|nr:GLUG motif-containing protein [Rhizomicrobium sp.]